MLALKGITDVFVERLYLSLLLRGLFGTDPSTYLSVLANPSSVDHTIDI